MRKSLFLVKALVIVMIAAAFNQSCTNLDEELFDSVTPDNFFNTEEEILAFLQKVGHPALDMDPIVG